MWVGFDKTPCNRVQYTFRNKMSWSLAHILSNASWVDELSSFLHLKKQHYSVRTKNQKPARGVYLCWTTSYRHEAVVPDRNSCVMHTSMPRVGVWVVYWSQESQLLSLQHPERLFHNMKTQESRVIPVQNRNHRISVVYLLNRYHAFHNLGYPLPIIWILGSIWNHIWFIDIFQMYTVSGCLSASHPEAKHRPVIVLENSCSSIDLTPPPE